MGTMQMILLECYFKWFYISRVLLPEDQLRVIRDVNRVRQKRSAENDEDRPNVKFPMRMKKRINLPWPSIATNKWILRRFRDFLKEKHLYSLLWLHKLWYCLLEKCDMRFWNSNKFFFYVFRFNLVFLCWLCLGPANRRGEEY